MEEKGHCMNVNMIGDPAGHRTAGGKRFRFDRRLAHIVTKWIDLRGWMTRGRYHPAPAAIRVDVLQSRLGGAGPCRGPAVARCRSLPTGQLLMKDIA
mgnify:CR=1 FL=1